MVKSEWRTQFNILLLYCVLCPFIMPSLLVGQYWEDIGRILGEVLPEVATDGLYKSGQLTLDIPTFGRQIGHKVPSKWGWR